MGNEEIIVLSESEIIENLKEIPGWKFEENKIFKEFKFSDYNEAINFIDSLTEVFQETDHHPDIQIHYSRVLFELTTHSARNRVTEIDFIVAREIERIFNESEKIK